MTRERKEIVVFLGPPGVGKGTQAKILSQAHHFTHISTGDLVRNERASGSDLGHYLEQIGWTDMLALDRIVLDLLESKLDTPSPLILDGCPRTLEQAENLAEMLARHDRHIAHVIEFFAEEATLIARLTNRFACRPCGEVYHALTKPPQLENCCDICQQGDFYTRPEDSEECARDRLSRFGTRIRPVLDYYAARGAFSRVNGEDRVEAVTAQLEHVLRLV